jgi:gliding motility-associated-like protein
VFKQLIINIQAIASCVYLFVRLLKSAKFVLLIFFETMIKKIVVFLFCLFATVTGYTQIDTAFWFAAPDVSSAANQGDFPVFLRFVTYSNPTVVTVSQPANGSFTPIVLSIPANSVDSINMTFYLASIENSPANVANNKGLKISATQPIGAMYELRATNNREYVSLKGSKALGTDFYTPFQTFWPNGSSTPQSFSSIEIVATEDGTTLLITPRTTVVGGHAANVSYTVALTKGQTFCVRDTNRTTATSLAGSIVSSNKPVTLTLFSGALNQSGTLSCLIDQITNSSYAGTDFVIRKGRGNNERVYVLSTQNNTNINFFGAATSNTVSNWSETKEYVITDSITYIKTSKPVYIWHVSGFGDKMSAAQVPNVYCAGTYNTAVTRTTTDSFALILYVRDGFQNQFTLNGNASLIPASAFATVPGTSGEFVCARIFYSNADVPVNSRIMVANAGDIFGLGMLSGNQTQGSAYAYFSEFNSYPFVNAGSDGVICANKTLSLTGLVGGGSVTGSWSTNGFGTFQNGNTGLLNTYLPSDLDTVISPIQIILTSTGPCPVKRDTIILDVTPGPIVSASADQLVCANNGVVTLNGSVQGASSTGIWSANGTGNFSPANTQLNGIYNLSAADTATGSVRFVLTATNIGTCNTETDTMFISITPAPNVNAGPASITVCSNNASVSLSGTVVGITSTGKWTTPGTGIFTPNNVLLNTTFQPSQADIIAAQTFVYLTSTNNGNCLPVKDSIRVIFTPSPYVDAGSNGFICFNDPDINLSGSISGATTTGVWSGGTGVFAPSSSNLLTSYFPTAAEFSAGSVMLTLTSTNNGICNADSDLVKIDFVPPPFANFSANNVCLGDPTNFVDFSLQGFGAVSQWLYDLGDGNTENQQNFAYTYAAPGTYTVNLIATSTIGCTDTMQRIIKVGAIPQVSFSDSLYCSGLFIFDQFTDNTTIITPDTIAQWYWDFGGQGASTLQNPSNVYQNAGNYQVTLVATSGSGCTGSAVTLVTVPNRPNASFYYNTTPGFNVGASVSFLDSSSNAIYYSWFFGDGNSSTEINPTNIYFSNGTFNVTHVVSDDIGCSDTAKATVIITSVSNEITQLIPNAISPNGDGKNDEWKLPFVDLLYPKAAVEIYNVWGQKVFESEGYKSPWNGTFKGELLPMGNYYYILNLNDPKRPEIFKGAILLVR